MAEDKISTNSYHYDALTRRQIRVVILYPPTDNEEIHCDIKCISIDENLGYEALSYTWGATSGNIPIQVGSGILSVTKNLAAALHALSPLTSQRTIWIDAICINQKDATERNHQAVDPEPDLLEHKGWMYSDAWDWSTCRPWQPLPVAQRSVDALLCRPWFSRVWIQQEAAVNRNTSVVCGKLETTWNQLFSLVWSYQKPSHEGLAKDMLSNGAQASALLLLNIQSYTYEDIPALLLDILRDYTYCGATNPRDRIYGVQSLARDPDLEELILEPNYNDDVSLVYTKIAERFLLVQGPFILGWAGRDSQRLIGLPSWAPDWTVKNIELPSIIYRAGGDLQGRYKVRAVEGASILFAQGMIVSSISTTTQVRAIGPYQGRLGEHEVFQSLKHHIKTCIGLCGSHLFDNKRDKTERDLWRVLVADSTRSWTRLPENYTDDLMLFPKWLALHDEKAPPTIQSTYLEYVETLNIRGTFIYRRFAIDSKGNMCLVPYSTKKDDRIVVVAGLAVPLVVRHTEKGIHEIIGECYVHRIMDGEAIEGSLKEAYEEMLFC